MRLSLGTLLISLFSAILLVVIVQGYFATNSMRMIAAGSRQIIETRVPSFILMGQINANSSDIRIAQAAYLAAKEPAMKEQFIKDMKDAQASFAEHRKAYEPLIVDKEDRELYDTFSKDWATYEAIWSKVKASADAGRTDEALAVFLSDAFLIYNKAGDDIQKAVDDLAGNVNDEGKANIASIDEASSVLLVALGVAIVVAAAAAVISNRRIIKPIRTMTDNMRDLAGGDTTFTVPYQDRKDEIGGMSAALQVFKDSAVRSRQLEAEAAAAREKAESEKARLQQEAEAAAALKLQQATAGLAAGLKRLAAGDLGFELTEPFSQEFEPLRHDLNTAVMQLGDTIGTVAQSAVAIGAGSREVSHSADDLSKRTEQQAASLEETAAALDEITVNVSNSAKRVQEARSVAREANGSAVQSGKVVAEAIEAMQRIEQSSNQISNIIGVIDEIAFQTNLLALNAGVEAARAGEAGRGFAVVATEVRELAQRSAKAAREIKGLITNSAEEVGNGVTHVRETGNVLKDIEQHIMTINGLMDAIATSAQEQSVGLSEVNTAVNQMDQVTQQNAAMVEETSAASANLASESARLQQLVSGFTLRGNGGSVARRAA